MKKELKRSASDCKIFGVCGGIAEYFGIDSNVVRLVWVAISLFAGTGVLLYLIAAFILPKGDEPKEKDLKDVIHPESAKADEEAENDVADASWEKVEPEEDADTEGPDLKDVIHPED